MMYFELFLAGLIASYTQLALFQPKGSTINPFNKRWWTEKVEQDLYLSDRKTKNTMFENYIFYNIAFWVLVGIFII